jgi:hypothetical protein
LSVTPTRGDHGQEKPIVYDHEQGGGDQISDGGICLFKAFEVLAKDLNVRSARFIKSNLTDMSIKGVDTKQSMLLVEIRNACSKLLK